MSCLFFSFHASAEFLDPAISPQGIEAKKFEEIKKSVFRFYTKGDLCTGFFVSSEGAFVTSMHCFHKCLKDSTMRHAKVESTISGDSLYVLDQERMKNGNTFCTIKPDGEDFQKVTILASGRGFSDKGYENKVLELHNANDEFNLNFDEIRKLRKLGYGSADDFVIAQISSNKPRVCQSIQTSKRIQPKDLIWTVGYPSKAIRESRRGSDGVSMQLSVGKVNQSILQNPCISYSSDIAAQQIQEYQDIPGMIWTTLDSSTGASGSPTFDSSGKVNGILTSVTTRKGSENEYCSGGVSVLKLETIYERLKETWSEDQFNSILKCQNNEIQKGNL